MRNLMFLVFIIFASCEGGIFDSGVLDKKYCYSCEIRRWATCGYDIPDEELLSEFCGTPNKLKEHKQKVWKEIYDKYPHCLKDTYDVKCQKN